MFFLFSSAFALTCSPGDLGCESANEVRDAVNALGGTQIIDGAARRSKSTEAVLRLTTRVHELAGAAGCTVDGVTAMAYSGGAFTGTWSDSVGTGTVSGSLGGGTFSGTFAGDASGTIGDEYAFYNSNGKLAGNMGSSFMVGGWVRGFGGSGVAYGLTGVCSGQAVQAFRAYMPELRALAQSSLETCPVFATGPALDRSDYAGECGACVQTVCDNDNFCCDVSFDSICVNGAASAPECGGGGGVDTGIDSGIDSGIDPS